MFVSKIIAGVLFVAGSTVVLADIEGPFFPPPADSMFSFTSSGTDASLTGGVTYTYSGHDSIEIARGLYYGKWADVTFAASLDGPVTPSEFMAFSGISGAGSNVATWTGQSQIWVFQTSTYVPTTVTTRFTMTVEDTSQNPIPFAVPASIDGDFPSGTDAVIRVTGDFTSKWLLETFHNGSWTPMNTLFDSLQTPPDHFTAYDLGTGYYTDDMCPVDTADPIGVLDLADIVAFVNNFVGNDPAADLAAPFGTWDLEDILVFVTLFQSGCP